MLSDCLAVGGQEMFYECKEEWILPNIKTF